MSFDRPRGARPGLSKFCDILKQTRGELCVCLDVKASEPCNPILHCIQETTADNNLLVMTDGMFLPPCHRVASLSCPTVLTLSRQHPVITHFQPANQVTTFMTQLVALAGPCCSAFKQHLQHDSPLTCDWRRVRQLSPFRHSVQSRQQQGMQTATRRRSWRLGPYPASPTWCLPLSQPSAQTTASPPR